MPGTLALFSSISQMAAPPSTSRLRAFLNHPAGPKTIHFWAPTFKWFLVLASLSDLTRPPQTISISQSVALGLTGIIWTRWSMIIKPKNWNLAAVNVWLAGTAIYQIARVEWWRRQEHKKGIEDGPSAPA